MKGRLHVFAGIGGIVIGLACLIALGAWFFLSGPATRTLLLGSYLLSYLFWFSLCIGCFGFAMLHHVLRARWSFVLLRLFEAGGGPVCLLFMGILLLPVLLQLRHVYPWAGPNVSSDLVGKGFYLNTPDFWIRSAFYFVCWILVSWVLRRSTRKDDQDSFPSREGFRTNLSSPALVGFFITVSFASFDWAMSLEPHYASTIYGLLFIIGSAIGALAVCVAVYCRTQNAPSYQQVDQTGLTQDMGNILLTCSLLWAYFAYSQYIIVWSGNIGDETPYYLDRGGPVWGPMVVILLFAQFFIPFILLLSPPVKRYPALLAWVAALMLVGHFIDIVWTIGPAVYGYAASAQMALSAFLALVGIGGVWAGTFSLQFAASRALPNYKPAAERRLQHVEA